MIPTCEVVELEMVSMIATSPGNTDVEIGDPNDKGFTEDANRHRGEWGNLWNR